ncbi:MAG: hypothetical protein JW912_08465 [Sedimentisphaerales bacterium]|nr:hypothetical protein [Sedimentisphaerales bacterium]
MRAQGLVDMLDGKTFTIFTVVDTYGPGFTNNAGGNRLYGRGHQFIVGDPALFAVPPTQVNIPAVRVYKLDADYDESTDSYSNGNISLQINNDPYNIGSISTASQGSVITFGHGYFQIPYTEGEGNYGKYAEIIVYDRALTAVEENAVGYYLAQKYNITGALFTDPGPIRTLTISTVPAYVDAITPSSGVYQYITGQAISLEAVINYVKCPEVFKFVNWSSNVDDPSSASTGITLNNDAVVTATFEDVRACGDKCHPHLDLDLNYDCMVNFEDLTIMASEWLTFTASDLPNPKYPYRVIYSNDTTNIITCESPYNTRSENTFTEEKFVASIQETADTGIDVHMLQPGLGWVPWWESQRNPYSEHAKWYRHRFGKDVSPFGQYMLAGGDIVGEFIDICRQRNLTPFISLRLNDWHYKERVDFTREQIASNPSLTPASFGTSKFYDENHQYRIGPQELLDEAANADPEVVMTELASRIRQARLFNWVYPEVRQQKLDFIEEICTYDIAGLELDFMRHIDYFFPLDETTFEQRRQIMVDFVADVRQILDQSTPHGRHRWLCVRIPFRISGFDMLGVDPAMFAAAGVDVFNLSCNFVMEQQNDLASIAQLVSDSDVYLEMTHTINAYTPADTSLLGTRSSNNLFILGTPRQYYTAAHLAYSRGASGVTMFNFQYFRVYPERSNATMAEPPFEIFRKLQNQQWLSEQPQHYYLSRYDAVGSQVGKVTLVPFVKKTYYLDMAAPSGGWQNGGRLRIQTLNPSDGSQSTLRFNGTLLAHTDDISEPYSIVHPEGLGNEETLRAWSLPPNIIIDGYNKIEFTPSVSDTGNQMIHLDIAVR